MTDYSQYGEQTHILEALGHRATGRFLDIGAYDPFRFSNTRALVELGWSGVMVEPSPGPMHNLLKEYGKNERITLIQALASDEERDLTRIQITDEAVSTTKGEVYKTWKDRIPYLGTLLVPNLPIHTLLSVFGPFDFVNIDAEGASGELLIALLSCGSRRKPSKCICVEHDGSADGLREFAEGYGYSAQNMGINLLLWR